MADVEIEKHYCEVERIRIKGEELESDDGNTFFLPKGLAQRVTIDELPGSVEFEICDRVEDGLIIVSTTPFSISRAANNMVRIMFDDSGRRKYWDGDVGFKKYMETKRDIIIERQREVGDVIYETYDDDGDYIFLKFSAAVNADTVDDVISIGEQLISEIDGAVDLALGSLSLEPQKTKDETGFVLRLVVPLLRKLGFGNVKYNHGTREFGKDILFSRRTEFGDNEQWGCQAKYGDVHGGADSEVDKLIGQIEDAFTMPFYNVYTLRRERISFLRTDFA